MKDFKNMSDNTVLRVRVPKALYESIKKELEKESVEEAEGGAVGATALKPTHAIDQPASSDLQTFLNGPDFSQLIAKIKNKNDLTKLVRAIGNEFIKKHPQEASVAGATVQGIDKGLTTTKEEKVEEAKQDDSTEKQ